LAAATLWLRQSLPSPDFEVAGWARWGRLAPHLDTLLQQAEKFGLEDDQVAWICGQYGLLLHYQARHRVAEPLLRRALVIDEKSFGPEHPSVAIRLNNLAQLLKATNRLEEAEPLMRRALAIDEKNFGPKHPNVARDLNNLAQLLKATNRLGEAESPMRRALAIDEKSFGPEHPKVALRLNNLSNLLQDTNRLAEAEPPMRRALVILLKFTRATGHSHPEETKVFGNYIALLKKAPHDENRIEELLAQAGSEAAFDAESFRTLREELGR